MNHVRDVALILAMLWIALLTIKTNELQHLVLELATATADYTKADTARWTTLMEAFNR